MHTKPHSTTSHIPQRAGEATFSQSQLLGRFMIFYSCSIFSTVINY